MCVVLAVMRLRAVAKTTAVLFRLERVGGGPAVCVIGDVAMVTKKGQDVGGRCPVSMVTQSNILKQLIVHLLQVNDQLLKSVLKLVYLNYLNLFYR